MREMPAAEVEEDCLEAPGEWGEWRKNIPRIQGRRALRRAQSGLRTGSVAAGLGSGLGSRRSPRDSLPLRMEKTRGQFSAGSCTSLRVQRAAPPIPCELGWLGRDQAARWGTRSHSHPVTTPAAKWGQCPASHLSLLQNSAERIVRMGAGRTVQCACHAIYLGMPEMQSATPCLRRRRTRGSSPWNVEPCIRSCSLTAP